MGWGSLGGKIFSKGASKATGRVASHMAEEGGEALVKTTFKHKALKGGKHLVDNADSYQVLLDVGGNFVPEEHQDKVNIARAGLAVTSAGRDIHTSFKGGGMSSEAVDVATDLGGLAKPGQAVKPRHRNQAKASGDLPPM